MTPADEATFIQLWQEGLDMATIAQRLGTSASSSRRCSTGSTIHRCRSLH
jgi:hypothetical protein